MKIHVISIGTRMPDWVDAGIAEYSRRLPAEFELFLTEVPLARRGKGIDIAQVMAKESEALLSRVKSGDHVVALEVEGKTLSTEALARRVDAVRMEGRNLTLLIGGPDGLGQACRDRAEEKWSLSALTLPHPLVRIVLAEQLYRVWSILSGHPYHRA